MKPGDLVWHSFKEGARMVVIIEVRWLNGGPEWIQVLDGGESLWTAAALIRTVDMSCATAG